MTDTLNAYAKINITLDIVGKCNDGYHNLKSVMQTISLHDKVTLTKNNSNNITISVNWPFLVNDKRNIAYMAASLFFKETGIECGLNIDIEKTIPMGAGLGGGSADAAAVLIGLNKMFGFPLHNDTLSSLGLLCGSDVPFCLVRGTFLAEGKGEILTPLTPFPKCHILIVKPNISLGTKSVFESLNYKNIKHHPNTDGVINALCNGNLFDISIRVYNVLEEAVRDRYKCIDLYKGIMLDCGALGSSMTGSGTAVFGIFENKNEAIKATERFDKLGVSHFVTIPIN